jgi:DNA-binding CsgD family transcriptional regulator
MELKICLLLRLTSSDIAKVLCLSERSAETHRYNIRKKLGLGRGDDIHEVLARL